MYDAPDIPAIRPAYDEKDLKKLSPVEGLAALYGVPPQFLHLANWPEAKDYAAHAYRTFHAPKLADQVKFEEKQKKLPQEKREKDKPDFVKVPCNPKYQMAAIAEMLDGPLFHDYHTEKECLIVVNSYPAFFAGVDRGSGEHFMYHLACSIAAKRFESRDHALNFIYLGTLDIQQERWKQPKPKTAFAFGPITDDFVNYQYTNAIKFLYSYSSYTRILLLSVKDIEETLQRLRIDINHPNYIIQLGSEDLTPPKKLGRWASRTGALRKQTPTVVE